MPITLIQKSAKSCQIERCTFRNWKKRVKTHSFSFLFSALKNKELILANLWGGEKLLGSVYQLWICMVNTAFTQVVCAAKNRNNIRLSIPVLSLVLLHFFLYKMKGSTQRAINSDFCRSNKVSLYKWMKDGITVNHNLKQEVRVLKNLYTNEISHDKVLQFGSFDAIESKWLLSINCLLGLLICWMM